MEIPEIVTEKELQRRKKRILIYGLLSVVATGIVLGGAYWVNVNPELRTVAGGYFRQMMVLVGRF